MGIQGLLPQLKSIMSPIHVKDLKGCCVAVDTYSWLHKGALSCSTQLCKGIPTSRHIDYCMHRVNLLRHYGVKPILIFDGGFLPMKTEQENKRARSRKENLERAMQHESSGNSSAAYECYQKAVDISPAIAFELIQVLKREGISYIVAPYEADAQMAFLATTRQVDAVITEDSDLIAFGCPRIIYKMDKYGQGVEFQFQKLEHNRDLSFVGFSNDMLLEMCILSGCDYLPSLPGMGLKRAHALISKYKTYQKVIKHLKYSSMIVPPLYEESFKKAVWTFRHQRVYDTNKEDIVHLSNISEAIEGDSDFLGPLLPRHIAKAIAEGELDPISKMPFQGKENSTDDLSYQVKDFRPESNSKKLDLPVQKNVLTNYFCFASLEAKRKFSAPRSSPTNSDLANGSSPTMPKQVHQDSLDPRTNGLSGFSSDEVYQSDVKSSQDSMEVELSGKKIEDSHSRLEGSWSRSALEQSCRSIPKPCSVLRNGVNDDLRNSFLQQSTVDENGPTCKRESATLKSSYFLEKPDDNDLSSRSKKVVVRSSYFKHKQRRTLETDENNRSSFKENSSGAAENEKIMPETDLVRNDFNDDRITKRKAFPNQIYIEERAENKLARTERFQEATRTDNSTDSDKLTEVKPEEEKFGCKISHLRQYSDISEKSMDKFVSVISSFRFASSGSRASGLRPPLKDVKNVCPLRSVAPADIANFSYMPNTSKVARAPGKRR
ncbi:exonuclease 1 [Silene latifolia]|uniref:exonuclease 1 n=1 Tax=Silene latifolia TaxID=37657 RepID=UPI003D778E4F